MCNCEWCQLHRRVEDVKTRCVVSEMKDLIGELFELYANTEFDLDYYKAIFDGSWPSAKEQALEILERAKMYQTKHEVEQYAKSCLMVHENGCPTCGKDECDCVARIEEIRWMADPAIEYPDETPTKEE